MQRTQLLDLYFLEARAKLIDLAAFMDRVDRGEGEADIRYEAFKQALKDKMVEKLGGDDKPAKKKLVESAADIDDEDPISGTKTKPDKKAGKDTDRDTGDSDADDTPDKADRRDEGDEGDGADTGDGDDDNKSRKRTAMREEDDEDIDAGVIAFERESI